MHSYSNQQVAYGTYTGKRRQSGMKGTYSGRMYNSGMNQHHQSADENATLAECQIQRVDRVIEVPEVQILERIVPVYKKIQKEKIIQVPRIEIVERRIPVPKTVYEEKIIEVPQVQYREVIQERIVEYPEYVTQFVNKEVPVPEHVDIALMQPVQAPIEQEIQRNVPVLVDLITTHGYEMPQLKPKYKDVMVPIYVPRYIEVPVAAQLIGGTQSGKLSTFSVAGSEVEATTDPEKTILVPTPSIRSGLENQPPNYEEVQCAPSITTAA